MGTRRPRGPERARPTTNPGYGSPLYALPSPPTGYPVVVSRAQVEPLLAAWAARGVGIVETSADLGLSTVAAPLDGEGARYPDGARLSWEAARRVVAAPNQCFEVGQDRTITAIAAFSETTNALRSLMPTAGAPTMLVSGFSMHRIKGTEPWADTRAKLRALGAVAGRVLDTTTGLGYTALMGARAAGEVVTIELDPTGLAIARRNPWSSELFTRPNITRLTGDAFEVVATLSTGGFDCVIHDPPYLSLAGELYSGEMYRRIHRVLRPGGKLFHYIGDPASQSGARVTAGVIRRLEAAGFSAITRRPEAFGVTATR